MKVIPNVKQFWKFSVKPTLYFEIPSSVTEGTKESI